MYWWKGSMITDTFTINKHAHVVVYMYLIFVMTGLNICNDGDKGVQIYISPTFIEPRVLKFGMHQCWMQVRDTDGRTDRHCWYICKLACSTVGKTDTLIKSHVGTKMKENPVVYELLKITNRKKLWMYELIHDILVRPPWNNLWCTKYSSVRTNTRFTVP